MSRTRLLRKTRFGAAAYLVLAVLFALRCSVAWAAADVATAPAQFTHASPLAAQSRILALAALRPAPARCEAASDDPPPPSTSRTTLLRQPPPSTTPAPQSTYLTTGLPAPPPPARGPPVEAV